MEKKLEQVFSYFEKPIKTTKPLKTVSLEELHNLITSIELRDSTVKANNLYKEYLQGGSKTPYDKFKASRFDFVTFHGEFETRADHALNRPSGYFIADIDHLGANLQQIRRRLITDPVLNPYLVFISPSNDGLKVILKIDTSLIDLTAKSKKMHRIWEAVNRYVGKYYADLITPTAKGEYIDGNGQDLVRACFICYDPLANLNINQTNILDENFISQYGKTVEADAKSVNQLQDSRVAETTGPKVSPRTRLDDLAKRHLLLENNHYNHLLAFISAAKTIGMKLSVTLDYTMKHVKIDPSSKCSNIEELKKLITDIYKRYGTKNEEAIFLTELEFGYKIFCFKYKNDASGYVLTSLFMDGVRNLLHSAGFAKREVGKNHFIFIQKKGSIISEVTPEIMKDYMLRYLENVSENLQFTYQGTNYQLPTESIREVYFKNSHNIFNSTWLQQLQVHDEPLLKDTASQMYFFFQDKLVTVEKSGIRDESWDKLKGYCIWDTQVIKHDFDYNSNYQESHFYKFLTNVTGNDIGRIITMKSGIGYLLHHHFKESEGQAVVFLDSTITDIKTPQGGSGKGLIIKAISMVRNVAKIDGKHLDQGDKFKWSPVTPSTQLIWIDDVKPDFAFSMLHSNLTDGWTIERKNQPQFLIPAPESPKTTICSNSIPKGGGSTNIRRQFLIELGDFYSKQIITGNEKPIEATHGCVFFDREAWNKTEWDMFFSVMLDAGFHYLNYGLVPHKGINIKLNRLRQVTDEDFATWVLSKNFVLNERYDTKILYQEYIDVYYDDKHKIGQRTFSNMLKDFAQYKGWKYTADSCNGVPYFIFEKISSSV